MLQKENPSSQVEKLNEANFSFYTKLPEVIVCPGGELVFNLELHVAPGLHLNTDAPNSWKLSASGKCLKQCLRAQPLLDQTFQRMSIYCTYIIKF